MQARLPYIFEAYGIPPKKRTPYRFFVHSTHDFTIPEARPSDLTPCLIFRYTRPGREPHDTLLHECGDRLMKRLIVDGHRFATVADLETLQGDLPLGYPEALRRGHRIYSYSILHPDNETTLKRVQRTSRAESIAATQRSIDENLIVSGLDVWERASPPMWCFNLGAGAGDTYAYARYTPPDGHLCLPPDCRDLVDEFREWYERHTGTPVPISEKTDIIPLSTSVPLSPKENPVVINASFLAARACNSPGMPGEATAAARVFFENRSVETALEFVRALDQGARHLFGAGRQLVPHLPNDILIDSFNRLYELLPEGYKIDADETIDLSALRPTP